MPFIKCINVFCFCFLFLFGGPPSYASEQISSFTKSSHQQFPQRIVSLAPAMTDLILSLDCGQRLVGISRPPSLRSSAEKRDTSTEQAHNRLSAHSSVKNSSPFIEKILDGIPDVGPYHRPSLEKILMLEPDICLGMADGTPPALLERLRSMGISVFAPDIKSPEDLFAVLQKLGAILGVEERAEALVEDSKRRLAAIEIKKDSALPTVFIEIQDSPLMGASELSLIGKIPALAGGRNILDGKDGRLYPLVSREEILRCRPSVLLLALTEGQAEFSAERWRNLLPASTRIIIVDPDLFTRPSLRLLEAAEELAAILHEER